ncbi:MAG TPA: HAD family phosphatase [Capsulimonadaceae bacterium]|jgi:beta-phosphoglucomutase-like phosphatase (HAD superfamily)
MTPLKHTSDGRFDAGRDGVLAVTATGDKKVEFVEFQSHTLAHVCSSMGFPAYYPMKPARIEYPIKAVLMDLDGTTVHSEEFWMWIIEKTTASLLRNESFRLDEDDATHVSGHSVSEHLQHCIRKYCPSATVEQAREYYFQHTRFEMNEILEGRGKVNAFTPSPGIKEFLVALRGQGVKLGLVTSGLYEKAWPEILSAFRTLDMGDPVDFYDASITAGYPLGKGRVGTLGELCPKPHPWLYAETARVGLGIPYEDRSHVVGIEDSGAGVCSIRLSGFAAIGIAGGNIIQSGTQSLCAHYCNTFEQILKVLFP